MAAKRSPISFYFSEALAELRYSEAAGCKSEHQPGLFEYLGVIPILQAELLGGRWWSL